MPAKCGVIGCEAPTVGRGLCAAHYKRLQRHGHVESTRAADYGKRHAHPAYKQWTVLVRVHRQDMPKAWVDDFWTFVAQVPERPEGKAMAHRPDKTAPWGPNNFYWKTPKVSEEQRAAHATYMRDYHRKLREHNPRYYKDRDLQRTYGVTLEWYDAQHAKQKGLCAICDRPESAVIGGKVLQLSVDHCHEHGHTRELLCSDCNRALGMFKDDPELIRKAAAYLDSHKALW